VRWHQPGHDRAGDGGRFAPTAQRSEAVQPRGTRVAACRSEAHTAVDYASLQELAPIMGPAAWCDGNHKHQHGGLAAFFMEFLSPG